MRTAVAVFLMVDFCRFAPCAQASDNDKPTGRIEGTVIVGDQGPQSYSSGSKVLGSGPVTTVTETNAEGKFVFVALPAGVYTVEATSPGLEDIQTTAVEANQVAQIQLQMRPTQVNTSVTVTANETDAKTPAPMETINEKTIRDAPNMNERFDTLLPLVPGVVRGPDGHINLKGASSSQNGALVNSANVTDPATGSPAINLPIDVVSSVHVMSNPYDPGTGRWECRKCGAALNAVKCECGGARKYVGLIPHDFDASG